MHSVYLVQLKKLSLTGDTNSLYCVHTVKTRKFGKRCNNEGVVFWGHQDARWNNYIPPVPTNSLYVNYM